MASAKMVARVILLAGLLAPLVFARSTEAAPKALAASAEWSVPVNLSQSGDYDNAPTVAAAANGSLTIAWERRVLSRPTSNNLLFANAPNPGGPFAASQLAHSEPQKSSGSLRARADSLGRRHIIWWQYEGSSVCDYYARMEPDGRTSIMEKVPGTCGQGMKNTALAVGPDNNAYILFGQNLHTVTFWVRTDGGWTVQGERLPGVSQPEHLSIGVTRGGTVIAAWKDVAPKGFTDIFTAIRRGAGNWAVEDVSASLSPGCAGNSRTYYPALAPDPAGGMRLAWADERCNPRNPPPEGPWGDIYYREWTPQSGWTGNPVPVSLGVGDGAQTAMVVDNAGVAHIAWVVGEYQSDTLIYYSEGRGTSFTRAVAPFQAWANGKLTKDIDLAYSPGWLHLVFNSDRDDPQKEIYYSRLPVAEAPPTPAPPSPTPTPQPTAAPLLIPGSGSRTFPETGKTLTGLFLSYWDAHGALPQQGFPVSPLVDEISPLNGKPYTMQYTERAVFEYHPENQTPFDVLLSQLGTLQYKRKYPNGAPGQVPNTSPGSVLVPETGKRLGGRFFEYWQTHGGVMQQGYPISDEFTEVSDTDGKPYKVQYFERAVFEWHPENRQPYDVLLSLLGTFQYRAKYGR
jgi:hypothetical protein